ncbi:MAG: hypothetical protein LBR23_06865 [Spirochaetaceae bacterium]|jgi:hypothetical protein|nr:hypothetical protein [Spirochaetaceae bacterium]
MKRTAAGGVLFLWGLLALAPGFAAPSERAAPVFALEEALGPSVAGELLQARKLYRTSYREKTPALFYAPRTPLGQDAARVWNRQKPPVFIGELLFLFPKKTQSDGMEQAAEVIQGISTMEGVQYYSNTRRKTETLYTACYMIDNPSSRTRIPDIARPVQGQGYYFFQRDNSLGTCVYTISFARTEGELSITYKNVDPIKFTFIPVIKEGDLSTHVVVADVGADFLMYVLVQSLFPSSPLIENTMIKSFVARAEALAGWFNDRYTKRGG